MVSKCFLQVILLISMLLASTFCVGVHSNSPSRETGNLSGYVTDTFMNPIKGALVRVYFHETFEEDYSDVSGYYHVTNIPLCYCLKNATCSKPGYQPAWVLLSIGENTTYDFTLSALNQTCYPVFNGTMGTGGWYISSVTVSFVISGDVDEVFYKLDGEVWNYYSEPFEICQSGLHTFYWYYTSQGTTGETQFLPLLIDLDVPTLQLSSERISMNKKKISAETNDTTSGVSRVEFFVDGVLWDVAFHFPYECFVNGLGSHQVKAVSFDCAGNSVNSTLVTSFMSPYRSQYVLSFLSRFLFLIRYVIFVPYT